MNALTSLRDLVYQNRFSEAFRGPKTFSDKTLVKTYIAIHSNRPISKRKTIWLDFRAKPILGYSSGNGHMYGYKDSSAFKNPQSYIGNGLGMSEGDGESYSYGAGEPRRYEDLIGFFWGHMHSHGYTNIHSRETMPWRQQ